MIKIEANVTMHLAIKIHFIIGTKFQFQSTYIKSEPMLSNFIIKFYLPKTKIFLPQHFLKLYRDEKMKSVCRDVQFIYKQHLAFKCFLVIFLYTLKDICLG